MKLKVESYKDAREYFDSKGYKFTVESLEFMLDHKKSMAQLADSTNEENCVYMLTSVLPSKDKKEALGVIMEFINKGINIKILHFMLKELAKEQDFFMSPRGLSMLEEASKDADLLTSQEIMEIVTSEVMTLEDQLKTAIKHG